MGKSLSASVGVRVALCVLAVPGHRLSVLTYGDGRREALFLPESPLSLDASAEVVAAELLESAVGRTVGQEAVFLEQVRTYTEPHLRPVTIAYVALVDELPETIGRAVSIEHLIGSGWLEAADEEVLRDAVERVRSKLEYTTVATSLLRAPFTIPDLRRVYEAVWGVSLHAANFRRKVLATRGFVQPTDIRVGSGDDKRHVASARTRASGLFERGGAPLLHPAMLRPDADQLQTMPESDEER